MGFYCADAMNVVLLLLAVSLWASPVGAALPAKPNVVLIMVDDMGFSDLSGYGSKIPMPHLDRLAAVNCSICGSTSWP